MSKKIYDAAASGDLSEALTATSLNDRAVLRSREIDAKRLQKLIPKATHTCASLDLKSSFPVVILDPSKNGVLVFCLDTKYTMMAHYDQLTEIKQPEESKSPWRPTHIFHMSEKNIGKDWAERLDGKPVMFLNDEGPNHCRINIGTEGFYNTILVTPESLIPITATELPAFEQRDGISNAKMNHFKTNLEPVDPAPKQNERDLVEFRLRGEIAYRTRFADALHKCFGITIGQFDRYRDLVVTCRLDQMARFMLSIGPSGCENLITTIITATDKSNVFDVTGR